MNSPHRIDDLVVDLSFEAAGKRGIAAPDEDTLRALVLDLLLPALDEALCAYPEDGHVWCIDTVDIDLGDIAWDSIQSELPRRIKECIGRVLEQALHPGGASPEYVVTKVSKSSVDTDVMEHFLRDGSLPLHASGGTAIDPEALLDGLLKAGSDEFVLRLRNSPMRVAYATRLAQQFSPRVLRELLQRLVPGAVAERYLGLTEQFEQQVQAQAGTGFTQRHDMRLVWEHVLLAALFEQPSTSVLTRQIGAAAAAAGQAPRLAAVAANIESAWVIRLAQRAPHPLPRAAAAPVSIPRSAATTAVPGRGTVTANAAGDAAATSAALAAATAAKTAAVATTADNTAANTGTPISATAAAVEVANTAANTAAKTAASIAMVSADANPAAMPSRSAGAARPVAALADGTDQSAAMMAAQTASRIAVRNALSGTRETGAPIVVQGGASKKGLTDALHAEGRIESAHAKVSASGAALAAGGANALFAEDAIGSALSDRPVGSAAEAAASAGSAVSAGRTITAEAVASAAERAAAEAKLRAAGRGNVDRPNGPDATRAAAGITVRPDASLGATSGATAGGPVDTTGIKRPSPSADRLDSEVTPTGQAKAVDYSAAGHGAHGHDRAPIALPATAPTRFTREGLMRALVRGDLHGRWDAVLQNQSDLLLEVVHQIGQRADLWPRVLVKLPDAQLHDITQLVAPVAASLLRPLLSSRAFFDATGGDVTHGNFDAWVQTVRMAAFSILFDADAKTTDARYFAHVLLGKLGGAPRERYVKLARAWSDSLHVAGAARSLVAAVAGLGKDLVLPVRAGAMLPGAAAPRDLYEALVASLDDARRDAGAEGLEDALDIATARDSAQLQQQLQSVRSGAIALGGERFSTIQLQNLITALLANEGPETGAGVVTRRATGNAQTPSGPGPFRMAMLQEIAANASKAADERRYLAMVLDQLVHGRVLDLESIIAATLSAGSEAKFGTSGAGTTGNADFEAHANVKVLARADVKSSAMPIADLSADASSGPARREAGPSVPRTLTAAAAAAAIAAEAARAGKIKEIDAMALRAAIASALTDGGDAAILSLAREQGQKTNTTFVGDVAVMFGLVSALVRADLASGGVDRSPMLEAIAVHAKRIGATVAYFRHILGDLVQGRLLDFDSVVARTALSAGAPRLREKPAEAPLVETPIATPDLYQVLLDSLGPSVRAQGDAARTIEMDRATATAAPRLQQWLRQIREGTLVLGGARFTTQQLKNLIKVQIESGEVPPGGQASAGAFQLSMQQAIEQHATLVADQHRYHKLVLEQLVYGRLLDLSAITERSHSAPSADAPKNPDTTDVAAPVSSSVSSVAPKTKDGLVNSFADPTEKQALTGQALRAEIERIFTTGEALDFAHLSEVLPKSADAAFVAALPVQAASLYRLVEAYVLAAQAQGAKRRNVMLDAVKEKARTSSAPEVVLQLVLADLVAGRAVDLEAALAAGENAATGIAVEARWPDAASETPQNVPGIEQKVVASSADKAAKKGEPGIEQGVGADKATVQAGSLPLAGKPTKESARTATQRQSEATSSPHPELPSLASPVAADLGTTDVDNPGTGDQVQRQVATPAAQASKGPQATLTGTGASASVPIAASPVSEPSIAALNASPSAPGSDAPTVAARVAARSDTQETVLPVTPGVDEAQAAASALDTPGAPQVAAPVKAAKDRGQAAPGTASPAEAAPDAPQAASPVVANPGAKQTAPSVATSAGAPQAAPSVAANAGALQAAPSVAASAGAPQAAPSVAANAGAPQAAPVVTTDADAPLTVPVVTTKTSAPETAPVITADTGAARTAPVVTASQGAPQTVPSATANAGTRRTAPAATAKAGAPQATKAAEPDSVPNTAALPKASPEPKADVAPARPQPRHDAAGRAPEFSTVTPSTESAPTVEPSAFVARPTQYVAPPDAPVVQSQTNGADAVSRLLQAFASGDFADLYMVWTQVLARDGAVLRKALRGLDLSAVPWSEVADGFPQSVLDDVVALLSPRAAATLAAWIDDEVLNEIADDAMLEVARPQRTQRMRVAAIIHLLQLDDAPLDEAILAAVLAEAMADSQPAAVARLMSAWTGEGMPAGSANQTPGAPTRSQARAARAALEPVLAKLRQALQTNSDAELRPALKRLSPPQLLEVLLNLEVGGPVAPGQTTTTGQTATAGITSTAGKTAVASKNTKAGKSAAAGTASTTGKIEPHSQQAVQAAGKAVPLSAAAATLHQLAVAILRADAASDGHDRSRMRDAIESHVQASGDPQRFMAHVLDDMVNDRVVDLESISGLYAKDGEQAAARASIAPAPQKAKLIETILPGRAVPMRSHHAGWIERALATHPPALRASLSALLHQADPSAASVQSLPQDLVQKIVRLLAGAQVDTMLRCAFDVAQTFMEAYPDSSAAEVTAMQWQYLFVHLFELRRGIDAPRLATGLSDYLLLRHGRAPTERMKQLVQRRFGVEVTGERERAPTAAAERVAVPDALPEEGESIYIGNAGQVLAAPYMPRLFSMVGLLEGGRFKDAEAAERAVHLMQLVVTGKTDAPEYQLGLNKILCGVGSGTPIVREIEATEQEKEVVEALIKGMIGHWTAIGKTSVAGLRETFLQRAGALYFKDDAWQLKVQPGPIDMLLDRLPWSFSIIKHPWMERSVHVTWR